MKTDVNRLEKQIKKLSERVQQMEVSMDNMKNSLQSGFEAKRVPPEDLSPSKASFRIDLYPRQGHYQGKIEHLGSTEGIPSRSTFRDLDAKAITDFIAQRLPRKAPTAETASADVGHSYGLEALPAGQVASESTMPPGQALPVISLESADRPTSKSILNISAGHSFEVQALLPPTSHAAPTDLRYAFSVYAQLLGAKVISVIGKALFKPSTDKETLLAITCAGLPKGMYRLRGTAIPSGKSPGTGFEWSRDYLDVY